jgi:hypothetical protein
MADNQLALAVDERIYKQWFQIADTGTQLQRLSPCAHRALGSGHTPPRWTLSQS